MDDADKSFKAYDKLNNSIPSIGFLSRKKRIIAYIKVTKTAQLMVDNKEISEENAVFLLSILVRKVPSFQKAAMMVALNLPTMDKKILQSVGFRYANEMRCNLKMMPVDSDSSMRS